MGRTTLRNCRHLKHQIKKNVTFADTDEFETSADKGNDSNADDSLTTSLDGTQKKFVGFSARLAAALTLRVHSCGGEAVGATLATLQSSFFSSFFSV